MVAELPKKKQRIPRCWAVAASALNIGTLLLAVTRKMLPLRLYRYDRYQ